MLNIMTLIHVGVGAVRKHSSSYKNLNLLHRENDAVGRVDPEYSEKKNT